MTLIQSISQSLRRAKRSHTVVRASVLLAAAMVLRPVDAIGQTITQRGFIEARDSVFPEKAPNDTTRNVGDLLLREEVFLKPGRWLQLAAGLDLRANSHDQVEDEFDFEDRSIRRPRAAVHRLTATMSADHLTLDIGKQFIRWARADVLNPTDRFAPRDYLNVLDTDFLPVLAVRPAFHLGNETIEVVWTPRFTPSRLPLPNQRWTVLPPEVQGVPLEDRGSIVPNGSQQGVRWSHTGAFDGSLSFFNGFNHLANIQATVGPTGIQFARVYPSLRSYGADVAIPTRWVTFKGEGALFTSPDSTNDEYVLYVIELERQIREWVLVAGYAGESVTTNRGVVSFTPDRGIARSVLARAAYTVDPRRTVAIEGAVRQSGDGVYIKGEYSQSFAAHWRLTLTGVGIGGNDGDFIGQYRRNSHGSVALRFSF